MYSHWLLLLCVDQNLNIHRHSSLGPKTSFQKWTFKEGSKMMHAWKVLSRFSHTLLSCTVTSRKLKFLIALLFFKNKNAVYTWEGIQRTGIIPQRMLASLINSLLNRRTPKASWYSFSFVTPTLYNIKLILYCFTFEDFFIIVNFLTWSLCVCCVWIWRDPNKLSTVT